jgi:putative transposase
MPRRTIQFIRGGIYHIYNRGAGRHSIFYEDENYLYLLRILKELLPKLQLTLLAYCLLPNHYHWLVRQDGDISAGELPQRAFNRYVKGFNKTYKRTGTLFEDRYDAILVDSDAYVRQLCFYIHANPVRHALAMSPGLWAYSNYLDWIGQRPGTLVDHHFVQEWFGSGASYAEQVKAYLSGQIDIPENIRTALAYLP